MELKIKYDIKKVENMSLHEKLLVKQKLNLSDQINILTHLFDNNTSFKNFKTNLSENDV